MELCEENGFKYKPVARTIDDINRENRCQKSFAPPLTGLNFLSFLLLGLFLQSILGS